MYVKNEKKDERLEAMKSMVNEAVEVFVEASKKADDKMAFRAFTLGVVSLEEQYALSDIILTQAAIHLKEYTHDSLEKYTYSCATSVEEKEDEKCLVIWFNFSREKPEPAKNVDLTDDDIRPPFLRTEEDKVSVEVVEDTEKKDESLLEVSGVEHVRCGATYDA